MKHVVAVIAVLLIAGLGVFFLLQYSSGDPVSAAESNAILITDAENLSSVVEQAAGTRLVLLGEASHGTAEFYTWRDTLSRALITHNNASFVAVEGDWAELYKVHRYVTHRSPHESAREVLTEFSRWPTWMWANEEFLTFVEWLHNHNATLPSDEHVGVYGKDLHGVGSSIEAVLSFFAKHDPDMHDIAAAHYECLTVHEKSERFTGYVEALAAGVSSCEEEVTAVVAMLEEHKSNHEVDEEEFFNAHQNALLVKNGELHLRSHLARGEVAWNNRVRYMKEVVNRISERYGPNSQGIVWAHNTHVGDARATQMAEAGMVNIGQLARERYGPEAVFIVGFGTNNGTVVAAREWGEPGSAMRVPAAHSQSYEYLFNQVSHPEFLLLFDSSRTLRPLAQERGHRAIGVTYSPALDYYQNYVPTRILDRYNAFIFIKETTAVNPL